MAPMDAHVCESSVFSQEHESDEDECEGAPLMSARTTYLKLEVVKAREIGRLCDLFLVVGHLGVVYTIVSLVLAYTVFGYVLDYKGQDLLLLFYPRSIDILFLVLASILSVVTVVLKILFGALMPFLDESAESCTLSPGQFVIAAAFTAVIARLPRHELVSEQTWLVFLLWATFLFVLPLELAISVGYDNVSQTGGPISEEVESVFITLGNSAYISLLLFYPWAVAHAYRLSDGSSSRARFYVPKIVAFAGFLVAVTVARVALGVAAQPVPFTTFVYAARDFKHCARTPKRVLPVVVLTVMEAVIFSSVVVETVRSERSLRKCNYIRYRSRRIGFALVKRLTATLWLLIISMNMLLATFIPLGVEQMMCTETNSFLTMRTDRLSQLGQKCLTLIYAAVLAFLMLPASVHFPALRVKSVASGEHGQRSAKRRMHNANAEVPITYRRYELRPREAEAHSAPFGVNCFVMDTHVMALNFAWLAYYLDSEKLDRFEDKIRQFDFYEPIIDKALDTHVLIAGAQNRVIVAFRGTRTAKNFRTDMRISMETLENVLLAEERLSPHLKWCHVHGGFGLAYHAIAPRVHEKVRAVLRRKPGPLLITGHSLGGSLATLCALDLVLDGTVAAEGVMVSTFGAPKVGDRAFRVAYDSLISNHWRVELDADAITRMPLVRYEHVGKQALLGDRAVLHLDSNQLETSLFKTKYAGIIDHRKASYLNAIRSWCEQQHGDGYEPCFWHFPTATDSGSGRFRRRQPWSRSDPPDSGMSLSTFEGSDSSSASNYSSSRSTLFPHTCTDAAGGSSGSATPRSNAARTPIDPAVLELWMELVRRTEQHMNDEHV